MYRTIDVRIHSDSKFRQLSKPKPCAQYLFIYLLTGPHTTSIPGLFRLTKGSLADELGWSVESLSKAFRELSQKGMAKADWEARLVWLPNAIRYNPPGSPNVVKHWVKRWDDLPECELRTEALRAFKSHLDTMSEAFRKPFESLYEAFRDPFANQEQEQEQEQNIHTGGVSAADATAGSVPDESPKNPKQAPAADEVAAQSPPARRPSARSQIDEVWAHYRTLHPQAAKVLKSTRMEYRRIRERLHDFTVDQLKAAIDGYHRSKWHCGDNDRGRTYLSLDLIMRDISHVQQGLEYLGDTKSRAAARGIRLIDSDFPNPGDR